MRTLYSVHCRLSTWVESQVYNCSIMFYTLWHHRIWSLEHRWTQTWHFRKRKTVISGRKVMAVLTYWCWHTHDFLAVGRNCWEILIWKPTWDKWFPETVSLWNRKEKTKEKKNDIHVQLWWKFMQKYWVLGENLWENVRVVKKLCIVWKWLKIQEL